MTRTAVWPNERKNHARIDGPACLCRFSQTRAAAADVRVDRIDVVGKGIYRVETGAVTKDPSAPTGEIKLPDSYTIVEPTDTIPARVGTEFGIAYRIVGAPEGAEVKLQFVNTYPSPGIVDPADKKPILSDKFERTKKVGVNYLGYGFENDWELVPGTWTMEIWYDGHKLVDESFTVVK